MMIKKLKRLTYASFLNLLKKGKVIEVRMALNGGFFTRHYYSFNEGKIRDESLCDGSISNFTLKEFNRTIYRGALDKGCMFLDEIIVTNSTGVTNELSKG